MLSLPSPIRIPVDGNPLGRLRLPVDYSRLSAAGQRLARINACRQWLLPSATPADYIASMDVFDALYLRHPDSLFYDMPPLPSPVFHHVIMAAMFSNSRNAIAAPRGSAKSKLIHRCNLAELVSCPKWSIIYAGSTHKQIKRAIDSQMGEIIGNRFLNDDWGAFYPGGQLRPRRGEALFGLSEYSRLTNGSNITFTSMESRNRGGRPRKFRLDDPEYDPEASTSMQRLQDEMERFIFKIVRPMLREGCGADWVGTTVSKAHLLYKAVTLDESGQPKDPRFSFWNRMLFKIFTTDDTGVVTSLWEEMYPAKQMESLKTSMGAAHFATEYMNEPGVAEGRAFDLDSSPTGSHSWWITASPGDSPLRLPPHSLSPETDVFINWRIADGSVTSMPFPAFIRQSEVFICCDYIRSPSPTSDFATSFVLASAPGNLLFALDGWIGRVTEGVHTTAIVQHALRWSPRVIGVEAPNLFYSLLHRVRTDLALASADSSRQPEVRAISQHTLSKIGKIDSLRWRFSSPGLIKLPLYAREIPVWAMTFAQITDFNPAVDNGGLEHDDCIDTIAMAQRLLQGSKTLPSPTATPLTIIDRLKRGETVDSNGLPLIEKIHPLSLSPDDQSAIIAARLQGAPTSGHTERQPNCI